jgi:RHS repeat-associated protein
VNSAVAAKQKPMESDMSRISRNLTLLWLLALCFIGRALASSTATITVGGSEQQISGNWDSGTITISFNGFIERVQYGQFSTPASIASAFAATFSRDYLPAGLCANATGPAINFKLKGNEIFGPLDVNGSTSSFQVASSGFYNQVSKTADTGTVTLTVNGVLAASTNYGDGATPSTIAEGLSVGVTGGSFVNVTATGNSIYLESKQAGAGTNYSYSLQTASYDSADFTQPSFLHPPVTGSLDGGANAGNSSGQTVYSNSDSFDNDNNLTGSTDTVMGTWGFQYDTLNRLISGTPTSGQFNGHNLCWSYDAFGNRTAQSSQTTACPTLPAVPTATAAYNVNNQVTWTTVNSGSAGFNYDAAGNVTYDNMNSYLYDADGRLCAVMNQPIQGTYSMTGYLYDAEGHRIAKGSISNMTSCDPAVNGFQLTNAYIIGLSGQPESELTMDSNNSLGWQHTNLSAAGGLLATDDIDETHFYLNDPLGTRRAQTDFAGSLEQTCTGFPYGDGISCTGSALFPTEQHFTSKERDTESGLDNFGARYYGSTMGRFMSPDPSGLTYADITNPQTFNLYGYALNNPLRFVDPSGMNVCFYGGQGDIPNFLPGGNDSDPTDYDDSSPDDCTAQGGTSYGLTQQVVVTADGDGSCGANNILCVSPFVSFISPIQPIDQDQAKVKAFVKAVASDTKFVKCIQEALDKKGISLGLDIVGAIPGVGNAVSAGVFAGKVSKGVIDNIVAFGSGAYGAGSAAGDKEDMVDSAVGAGSSGAGLGLTLAGSTLGEGAKAIPVAGNVVSVLSLGWDLYKAHQKYQECMAKPD